MRSGDQERPPVGRAQERLSRRAFLRRTLVVLAVAPLAKLGSTVARAERRRRNHRGADPDAIWIGHC